MRYFVYTDIRRDGTLSGPNLDALDELIEKVNADVIASGGMASLDDIKAVEAAGATGAIVGRALYDGRIDLGKALRAISTDRGVMLSPCSIDVHDDLPETGPYRRIIPCLDVTAAAW